MTATPTIAPAMSASDPLVGVVSHARTVLQTTQEPGETQQKDLIKSLLELLAASPAQQGASSNNGTQNGNPQGQSQVTNQNGNGGKLVSYAPQFQWREVRHAKNLTRHLHHYRYTVQQQFPDFLQFFYKNLGYFNMLLYWIVFFSTNGL